MALQPYFWLGAAVIGLATAWFATRAVQDDDNATFHAIVTAVSGIAAVAYAAMALGLGTVAVDGTTMYVVRYVDWLLTTPLILLYLGLLADFGRTRLAVLMVADAMMVLTGPLSAVLAPPLSYLVFATGVVLLATLLYYLLAGLVAAAEDRPAPVAALFRRLRNLTVVSWAFYPVVFLLGPLELGVVDPAAEVLLVMYLDVVSKVVFGFVASDSRAALDVLADEELELGLSTAD